MIKWFDADKFLPGKDCGEVLIRYQIDNHGYEIGYYVSGSWFAKDDDILEDNATKVTHWAFIEEPM
jgi:hypothetical protein